jgi:hypothetical protein
MLNAIYADCYTECHKKPFMLSVVMLSVIMLSVIMLSVVVVNVIMMSVTNKPFMFMSLC